MHGLWAKYDDAQEEELVYQTESWAECLAFAQAYPKDNISRLEARHPNGQKFVFWNRTWLQPRPTQGKSYATIMKEEALKAQWLKEQPKKPQLTSGDWLFREHLKDPYCRACGIKTIHPSKLTRAERGKRSIKYLLMATKDHIIPRSLDGPNHESNYQLLCRQCNEEKGNRLDFKPRVKYFRRETEVVSQETEDKS